MAKNKRVKEEAIGGVDSNLKKEFHALIRSMSPEIGSIVSKGFNIPLEEDPSDEDGGFLKKREQLNSFVGKFKDSLGPLLPAIDMIQSKIDERAANRLVDESIRRQPTPPSVRGENRILSNLIRQSEAARINPSAVTQPFIDQTNLGYQQDLARAREYSGGQAGTMVGLSQGAALRRDEGGRVAAQMAGQAYNEGMARTAGLVGQQMQDDIWRDQQNIDLFRQRDARNITEQTAAGQGLAATRLRGIQSRNNFYDRLLESPVFDVDSYSSFIRKSLINQE